MFFRLSFTLLFLSFFLLQNTYAQEQTPATTSWPDSIFSRISRDLSDDWIDETSKLSVSLFDELADLELFSTELGNVEISPRIRRQVFDNRDLLETYTVADTFRLPFKIGLWGEEEIPFPGANLSASFGIEIYFQGVNLRQVSGKELSQLEAPQANVETRLQNLRQARYGRWWNALIIPLRLPLTQKAYDRMDIGEISSWSLGGTLRLDGSFGWGDLGVLGADFLEINSGFTTYLSGKFRLSALKLNENKIRLKVARERNHGLAIGLGQSRMEYTLFDGFMVFGQNALGIQESVIPFSFQTSWEVAKGFDVVYDYDMSKETAQRAYFLATQGRLEESNKLALIEDSGVEHIIRRDFNTTRSLRRSRMKLSLIFQKQSVESWSLSRAHITTPDANYTIFESKNINVRGFDSIWGSKEEKRYELTASLDEDGSWINKDRVLDIRMTAKDSDMSGKELNSIITETKELSGIDLNLPVFPTQVPCRRCSSQINQRAWYGSVNASVQIELPGKILSNFLDISKEEYWPLLETAHGVPFGQWSLKSDRFWWTVERLVLTVGNLPLFLADIHMKPGGKLWNAWRVRSQWKRAAHYKHNNEQEKLVKKLGELFKQRHYNRELTRLMVLTTEVEAETPTIVDISAPEAFGRIRKVSGEFPPDNLARRLQRELEFDHPGPTQDFDPDMTFKDTKISRQEDGSIIIEFKLDKAAAYLHWHVEKKQSFGRRVTLLKRMKPLLEDSMGPGEVSIIIQKDDSDPFIKSLYTALNQDVPVAIRISASQTGNSWGEITELSLDAQELK